MTEQIDYFRNEDYLAGRQNGITDAVGGLGEVPASTMPHHSYAYLTGYHEGYKWGFTQFRDLDEHRVEG